MSPLLSPSVSPSASSLVVAAVLVLGLSCGGNGAGGGAGTGTGTGTPGGGTPGGSTGVGNGSGTGTGGGTPTGPAAEQCDGIDNDGNNIIDDVDTAGDGVCDCLRIATLGYRGQWGTGDVFNSWLNGKSINGATDLGSQTLTSALLAQFQVIVVQDVREGATSGVGNGLGRAYSAAEVQVLNTWVQNGGGLMTLIGYAGATEVTNVNRLLSPFSMSYGSTQILQKSGGQTIPVTGWATHALTANVSKVGVDNGYPVNGGTRIAWQPTPGSHDVGRATESGSGHVFVWGDEWITYDTEWQTRTDYQIERFWLNSLKWLTAVGQCQVPLPTIN